MKEQEEEVVRTSLATMRMVAPGLLEQRIHADGVLSAETLRETREARQRLCADRPCAVLCIIPQTARTNGTTSDLDHFRSEREHHTITALALVAHDTMMETISKVYFTFHPQGFRLRVFNSEREARSWLEVQMAEVAAEGGMK